MTTKKPESPTPAKPDYKAEAAELNYETARDQLAETVNKLEQGNTTLEESLDLWERGSALADRCEEWLSGARKRLDAAANVDANDADPL